MTSKGDSSGETGVLRADNTIAPPDNLDERAVAHSFQRWYGHISEASAPILRAVLALVLTLGFIYWILMYFELVPALF